MSFQIIEGDVVIRDTSGNPVAVVLDGAIYRLRAEAKIVAGTSNVEVPVANDTSIPANTFGVLATGDDAGTARRHQMRTTNPAAADAGLVTRNIERTNSTFYAVFDRITLATNKYIATLFNTSSTRKVVVQRIWVYDWQFDNVQGGDFDSAIYRISARTAGTTVTPNPEDTSDTLSAGITADTNSTAVTQVNLIQRVLFSGNEAAWSVGSVQATLSLTSTALRYERRSGQRGITLRQNQGISYQYITGDTDGTVSAVFEFTDEVA